MAQGLRDAILVRTGYGCNNACRFCAQGDWRVTRGDHPAAEVEAEVRRAVSARPRVLVLSGGEVTLRPELLEWVAAARDAGAGRVLVQTNGRMLAYKGFAERLVAAGADTVAVGLHGDTAALHEWLTRAEGSFEQAVAGIRRARQAGARVLVNTVITRPGFRHLDDIVRLAARLGVARVRFLWPRAEGAAADPSASVVPDPSLVAPRLWRARRLASTLGVRVSFDGPAGFPTQPPNAREQAPEVAAEAGEGEHGVRAPNQR